MVSQPYAWVHDFAYVREFDVLRRSLPRICCSNAAHLMPLSSNVHTRKSERVSRVLQMEPAHASFDHVHRPKAFGAPAAGNAN